MDGTVARVVEEGSTRGSFRTDASLSGEDESRDTDHSQKSHEQHHDDERSLPLREFYPYIRCALCNGFFIDATTITECLHTFCKSCIVKHFFCSNRCPNCSIVVHQTQPLYSIRPDRQLQDIVFKMVPYLEEDERTRIYAFYKQRGLDIPKPVASPATYPVKPPQRQKKDMLSQSVFTIPSELDVSLMLEFVGSPLERKYVRVSGEATVRHVELFIRRKMELSQNCKVDVVCGEHLLEQCQSLREVCNTMGKNALQDGMLVLHFGLVLPAQ
ncbi:Polycomb group RING finger protein 6 [Labeo rohita]|uniref:Polycomb group RING finger protein 6 n=1 Tax=Labeo rohita TaxID=84645 RepID=A0ABQ8M4P3_LABRO|nr:Polycomb group RING finger protein 6 [Labeo rohita]